MTKASGRVDVRLEIKGCQSDGNLVLYSSSLSALWASGTSGNTGAYLVFGDAGNLVVDSAAGTPLWTES